MVFELYKKMILSLVPENLKKQLKTEKGTIGKGVRYYLLAALVTDITLLISAGVQMFLTGAEGAIGGASGGQMALLFGFSTVWVLALLVIIPIFMVIIPFITAGLGYILCRILGGKGTFTNQFYHFSLIASGLAVITSLLDLIPCVGSLIGLILSVYYLYPTFLVYRSVHKLSNIRAGFVTILPVVLIIIAIILLVMLFASMMGALLASMASMAQAS